MAERSIAAVLKTVEGQPSQGSNPCLSAIFTSVYSILIFFTYTPIIFSEQPSRDRKGAEQLSALNLSYNKTAPLPYG
jgi:hypothetical protein